MINRILIRIKVVQMLYSYLLTQKETTFEDAKQELTKSQEKAYELYHALLQMICDLTRMQELNLDFAKNKYLPTPEELNPNMRFIDNKLVAAINANTEMQDYLNENPINWQDDVFMSLLLDKIKSSAIYEEYMELNESDLKCDVKFWIDIFKQIILESEDFSEFLESKSVYWNDDVVPVSTFMLKTIRKWGEGEKQKLMPMFKDKEDSKFGEKLFVLTTKNIDKYNKLIDKFIDTKAWDVERVAFMDRVILLTAIAEVMNFPKIPTSVTLNEYIEIAKYYSTNKSGIFVNGILDSIIKYLKKENVICKD